MDYVIILCPCCTTPIDVNASDDEQYFTCVSCNQKWSMVVSSDRCAEHAL